ncbi:hypothetical protein SAMN05421770_101481 [Granulicella rosea]|uniref:Uncharacterized protein n=1 Tax=Granulicella rosea TaxID=474952 RepID=A0A239DJF9_9BACT|nr:hypothetical protein [Granulicella rosea]SNS31998.1 hypothetical protein SAMN05421770_101481 [Granulicella rosea]
MTTFRRTIATCMLLGASLAAVPAAAFSQEAPIAPRNMSGAAATANWTTEQLITSTVHDAWMLSNKDEATFFEMVRTLAELSAKNRGITLPDDAAAGRRMGDYIKRQAKADTDQLLYVVVDKAVLMTVKPMAHKVSAPATK